MWNKIKEIYPIEKVFLFFMGALIIFKLGLGTLPTFGLVFIFVLIINKFEDRIRRDYDDTLNDKILRVLHNKEDGEE